MAKDVRRVTVFPTAEMKEQAGPTARAVWAALGNSRAWTIDELEVVTGIAAADLVAYLGVLAGAGYLALSGCTKAVGGETIVRFRLTKRFGPLAPYDGADGRFVDPNLVKSQEVKRTFREIIPSCRARMRVHAERLGTFRREELESAVSEGLDPGRIRRAWNQLVHLKEIVPADEHGRYRLESAALRSRMREYFLRHVGTAVSTTGITAICGTKGASAITAVLDMLAAEDYQVWASEAIRGEAGIYLVEERNAG